MTSLSAPLASIRDELAATTRRMHTLTGPLDELTWSRRPAEERWSAGECVEHLNITSRAFVPVLRDALRDGRTRGLTGVRTSYRLDLMGWLLLRATEPPVKRQRLKTPAAFVPASVGPKARVVAEYAELQGALIGILADAEGLLLTKIKLTSPFNARVHYSAYSALRVIPAHQRRHLWQAEQALAVLRRAQR
jgi:hypothetical protein